MRTFDVKTFERACDGRRLRAISITIDRIAMLMQWPSLTILRCANLIQMIDWINPRTPGIARIAPMKKANSRRNQVVIGSN
jgi:hypothetical protein